MSRTRLLAFAPVGLLAALVFVSPARASLVQNMQTINHDGQTFLTWDNLPGTGWKYRVYRALVPITSTDAMLDAEFLGCVGDSSAVDWRLSNVLGSRFTFRIVEGAPELDASRGLFVYTPDEGSLAYYCVTAELSGQGEDWRGVPGKNATTEPIFEGVGRPLPIHQRTLSIVHGGEDYVLFLSNRKTTSFPAMCSQMGQPAHVGILKGSTGGALILQGHGRGGNFINAFFGTGTPGEWVMAIDDYLPTSDSADFYFGYDQAYDFSMPDNPPVTSDGLVADYSDARVMYLLDWAQETFHPDRNRVYASGASMGGSFTFFMGWHHADRVAGGMAYIPKVCFGYLPDSYPGLRSSLDRIWGSPTIDVPTTIGPRVFQWMDGRQQSELHARTGSAPLIAFCGTQDDVTGWPEKVAYFDAMEQNHAGGTWFWDDRSHYQMSSTAMWAPMQLLKDVYKFRLDRSYPAFSNCSTDGVYGNGDPTTADSFGTLNGSIDWDPDVIEGPQIWQAKLWTRTLATLQGAVPAPVSARVDVSPRRIQTFTLSDRTQYAYAVRRTDTWEVLQSGVATPDDDGVLTIPQVQVLNTGTTLTIQPESLAGVGAPPALTSPRIQLARNPVRGWALLTLAWPHEGDASVRLLDVQGRVVQTVFSGLARGTQDRVFSAAGLAPGVYVMEARQGSTKTTERVVVLR